MLRWVRQSPKQNPLKLSKTIHPLQVPANRHCHHQDGVDPLAGEKGNDESGKWGAAPGNNSPQPHHNKRPH